MATHIARFTLLTLLAGTLSAQIPATYTDLYSTLQQDLGDWQSTIDVLCAGCPSYPWFGAGQLFTANANNGPSVVTTPNYMAAVDAEILMHKALGVRAIAVEVSFPMLYPGFFPAQGTTYDQWASFYSTVAAHIRNQGLQVIVESQSLIPAGVAANWTGLMPSFYATFTSFSQYAAARAAAVANVAALMNPDYFILQEEPDTETTQTGQPVTTLSNAVSMLNGSVAAARGTPGFTGKVGAGFGSWLQQYDAFAKAYTQQSCSTCVASKLDFLDIHLFPVNEHGSCSGCPNACVPCAYPDFVRTNAMSVVATAATATNYSGGPMQMTMSQGWLRKVRDTEWPASTVVDGSYSSGDIQEAREGYSFWGTDQSGTLLDKAWLTAVESLANYAHFLWLCPFNTQNWSAYITWSTANAIYNEGSTNPNNTPSTIYGLEITAANPARAAATYTTVAQAWHDALAPSDVTAPTAPTNFTAAAASPSAIWLTWTASADDVGVAGYQIWRNGSLLTNSLVSPFEDTGLAANTTYNYQIFAFDLANHISLAASASATTGDTTAPSVPTGLTAQATSAAQVNLSWTASTDPDSPVAGYFIYRNGTRVASATTNSYLDSGLVPSTTYTYTVSANDASGNNSAQSTAVSATTPADTTPPSVPTGLTPIVLSLSQISVSWTASTDPDSPVAGYFFYRNGVKVGYTTTTSFLDTGLLPLTLYTYTVAAYDAFANTSAQSTAVLATTLADNTAPSVPTGLAATVISAAQINLSWSASTDPDSTVKGYYIYRNGTKVASSTTTSYQNTGLTASTTYSFTVAAYDPALNTSAQSAAVSATTPGDTTPPTVPAGLTATATSLSQVNLSWTASTDPDSTVKGYNIYRNGTRVATSTTTSYQDSGLAPSTTYSYTVSAYDPYGNTSAQSTTVSATTLADTTAPSVPAGLTAVAVSNSQINLAWTASTDPDSAVTGYNVYQNGSLIGTSTTASFHSTGLAPGTTYSYKVSAYDPSGNTSAQSSTASATTQTDTTAPSTPTFLNANAVSSSEIDLSWRASSDPDSPVAGYNIYRGGTKVGTSTTTSYQDTGLTPSTFYSYKVSAYDPAGNTSGQSFSSSATTRSDSTAPTVPAGLTATAVSTSQINLSWTASTDPDSGVSGYNVYRNGSKVGTSTTTSYQDTGLAGSTTYSYTVSAYDAAGNTSSKSSSVSATTPADTTAPTAPTGLKATVISSSQINLSWNASTDPDSPVSGYNVYRNGSKVGTSSNTSYQDTGLTQGTTYSYTVSAYDASGNTSAQSSSVSATTSAGDSTPPSVPTGLNAFATSSSQISVSWRSSSDPDSSVAGYNVYRNGSKVGTSTNTSYQDTGLQSSTTYTYTVSAYDPSGNTSAQSSSVSAKTNNHHGGN